MPSRKAALVTGAATGIGRSAVLALARAGFDVALNYSSSEAAARETAAKAEKLGVRTLLVRCDVSDEAGVRAMLKSVGKAFERLDVLVNNAGTTASWKPKDLDTLSLENWVMHPCVQNVACVPVPDPELGEKMCACLVLKRGRELDLPGLISFLKDKEIARFKLPERLLICDDFPVSAFGKVSKKTLSELAATNAHH